MHPDTLALSFETGYERDYAIDPYRDYPIRRSPALLVSHGGVSKIYPFSELKKVDSPLVDHMGKLSVKISFDKKLETARVEAAGKRELTSFVAYFDDLKAFYRESEIFRAPLE